MYKGQLWVNRRKASFNAWKLMLIFEKTIYYGKYGK